MSPAGKYTVTIDTPGLLEAIEARVISPRPDCLIWTGAIDQGYGRVWVDGQAKRAHRVVWELKHGPIPEGLTVDHLCRIRACCNTDHLELVTNEENVRRGHAVRALAPFCKNGHEYTAENTRLVSNGDGRKARACRACDRERKRDKNVRRVLVSAPSASLTKGKSDAM